VKLTKKAKNSLLIAAPALLSFVYGRFLPNPSGSDFFITILFGLAFAFMVDKIESFLNSK